MKKENVLFIEECFRNIQQEKEVDKNIRLIQSAVKREFNISLEMSILDNNKQFFGMCIYPSMNEIELLTMAMMSNGDGKVKKYESYTSNNTHQLDVDGMVELLKEMGEIEE